MVAFYSRYLQQVTCNRRCSSERCYLTATKDQIHGASKWHGASLGRCQPPGSGGHRTLSRASSSLPDRSMQGKRYAMFVQLSMMLSTSSGGVLPSNPNPGALLIREIEGTTPVIFTQFSSVQFMLAKNLGKPTGSV